MEGRKLSVTQLNNYIKGVFDDELVLKDITVYGEVFECKPASGKTLFMTLKDEQTILNCVCFSGIYPPKTGDTVAVKGSVEYYSKGNRVSFVVENIAYFGQGKIQQAFLELKEKLSKEGLFDNKKPLPQFIKKIALITSETGAVIHDILSVLRKSHAYVDVVVYPVKVQGDGADKIISEAIVKVNSDKSADAIIVARGGGSTSDLAPFNTEIVARAAAQSAVPIISAVGHETDYTLCDFCASVRAGTPSIAAEAVCKNNERFIERFYLSLNRLSTAIDRKLSKLSVRTGISLRRIASAEKSVLLRSAFTIKNLSEKMKTAVKEKAVFAQKSIADKCSSLSLAVNNRINASESTLKEVVAKLNGANPLKIIAGGYSKVYKGETPLTSVSGVAVSDDIKVVVSDGIIHASVNKVNRAGVKKA